jgi:hypothetical protein
MSEKTDIALEVIEKVVKDVNKINKTLKHYKQIFKAMKKKDDV